MSRKWILWIALVMLAFSSLACGVGNVAAPAPAAPAPAAPAAAPAVPAAAQLLQAPAAAPQMAVKPAQKTVRATAAPAAAAPAVPATPAVPAAEGRPTVSPQASFQDYGVNPFVDTAQDHLSTFALDVDTGSYTIARNYVTDGQLPPQDAVRVEEFVNYFGQDYPYPPKGSAFGIHMDGAPSPFGETADNRILRVGVQGYDVPPEERKPANLTFVVDVSGSMGDNGKLAMVKSSLTTLVEQLRPSDAVGLVIYSTDARVVLPTSTYSKDRILAAIQSLKPENSTNAEAGLRLGYQMAVAAFKPDVINRVILASDGVANVGQTGPGSIWETIKEYAAKGINLTAVGVGLGEYNDVLLERLADEGNGTYHYVDSPKEAERLFVKKLSGTLQAIAEDTKVQVDFNPETVARYRLLGFENRAIADTEFRTDTGKAAQIGAGHQVTALYELQLKPETAGRLATVNLRWKDPASKEVMETEQSFDSKALAPTFSSASPRLQWSAIVAEFAEVLRGSPFAKGSTLAGVQEEAERASSLLPGDADVAEFVSLVQRAKSLQPGE